MSRLSKASLFSKTKHHEILRWIIESPMNPKLKGIARQIFNYCEIHCERVSHKEQIPWPNNFRPIMQYSSVRSPIQLGYASLLRFAKNSSLLSDLANRSNTRSVAFTAPSLEIRLIIRRSSTICFKVSSLNNSSSHLVPLRTMSIAGK